MSNAREELELFVAQWEEASKQFSEEKKKPRKTTSFFGMHNIPQDMGDIDQEQGEYWQDVVDRSMELNGLIQEEDDKTKPKNAEPPEVDAKKDGFGKDLAKKLGDVEFNPNPLHFSAKGQASKLRVTPNFTDGKELRELAKLKEKLYDLESELLGTDVRGGDTKALKAELESIRDKCETLSQKLIPDVKTDVS